ncbi:MAG: AbrB/MazE/SpoVT family DNA-binding domain-containing protein [Nitrospirae bacterium]|nr:AbrB/MazE/SpoVT family DNA-binding domain-containing protein [Nitrospirota bacterium]
MATVVKISPGGQVRVPKKVMEKLKISAGDYLDFDFVEGSVVVKAKKLIDADQAWFWEKEWQEAEREAEEDIKKGRLSKVFTSAEEGIAYLRKRRKELKKAKRKSG